MSTTPSPLTSPHRTAGIGVVVVVVGRVAGAREIRGVRRTRDVDVTSRRCDRECERRFGVGASAEVGRLVERPMKCPREASRNPRCPGPGRRLISRGSSSQTPPLSDVREAGERVRGSATDESLPQERDEVGHSGVTAQLVVLGASAIDKSRLLPRRSDGPNGKAVTNHGPYEERATGVEPATSSLGSCSTTGRKSMVRGDSCAIGHPLGGSRFLMSFAGFDRRCGSVDPLSLRCAAGAA